MLTWGHNPRLQAQGKNSVWGTWPDSAAADGPKPVRVGVSLLSLTPSTCICLLKKTWCTPPSYFQIYSKEDFQVSGVLHSWLIAPHQSVRGLGPEGPGVAKAGLPLPPSQVQSSTLPHLQAAGTKGYALPGRLGTTPPKAPVLNSS